MKDISVTLLCLLAIIPCTLFLYGIGSYEQKMDPKKEGALRREVQEFVPPLPYSAAWNHCQCTQGRMACPRLKLYGRGTVGKLPEWLTGLQNLEKLKLKRTRLTEVDGTKLPNLVILRLLDESFEAREPHHFSCRGEAFQSLTVLELDSPRIGPLEFPMAHSLFEGYHISRA
jgi:Leucine-rich repeat (LRR) protein